MKTHIRLRVFLPSIILFSIGSAIALAQTASPEQLLQQRNREADPEFKRQREAWLRSMHRTEPGVDYRLIDDATRESKRFVGKAAVALRDSTKPGGVEAHWTERGSRNQSGRMHTADIDFGRGFIYAGSSGGHVWRGAIDGKNWTTLNDQMRIGDIRMVRLFKRGGATRIVVLGNSPTGVFYSENEGATWTQAQGLETPPKWGWFRRGIVANDQYQSIYVLCVEWDWVKWRPLTAIYRSTDLGENFAVVARYDVSSVASELFDIWTPRYEQSPVYLIHRDTLSVLTPANDVQRLAQFTIDRNFSDVSATILQGHFSAGELTLYPLAQYRDGTAGCFASTNAGKNWTKRGAIPFHLFNINAFAVSTQNEMTMFAGGVDVHRSIDGGRTWRMVNSWVEYYGDPKYKLHADIPEIAFFRAPSGDELSLVCTDGGLYISQDTMAVTTNLSLDGLNVSQYYGTYTHRVTPSIVCAGSQDQGFQRSMSDTSKAKGFSQLISGDYGHLTSGNDGTTLWCNYPGFTLLYPDITSPSAFSRGWDFKQRGRLWLPMITAHPKQPNVAYIACGGIDTTGFITRLTYDTLVKEITSQEVSFDFSLGNRDRKVAAIAISPIDPAYMYVATTDGKFFTSDVAGLGWKESKDVANPGSHYFYGSCILPSARTPGQLIVAGSGYSNPGAFLSTDHGKTFRAIDRGLPKTLVYGLAQSLDESLVFAATEVGPYMYVAADSCWYDIGGKAAPEQVYWSVEFIPALNTARFGTYGRGIWDYTIDRITSTKREPHIVPDLQLATFPNPMQSHTEIAFTLSERSHVTLRIFDLLGRIVAEPIDGELIPGTQRIRWNRTADSGYRLPAGTYLAIIAANGRSAYAKLVVNE